MFWRARILILTIWNGLVRLWPGQGSSADRMADSLRWIVHPRREDTFGHLEAALICRCAARSAAKSWTPDRMEAVARKLQRHAAAVRSYAARPVRLNVERLLSNGDDGYPVPSDDLQRDLQDLTPFLTSCETKLGGDGIEF